MAIKKFIQVLCGLGLLAALVPAVSAAPVAQTGGCTSANLLSNASFEGDWYRQGGVVELSVPGDWAASYLDGYPFDGSASVPARRPEIVVWNRWQASDEDKALFLHGEKIVKMFKPWAPVKFALSQNVSNLKVGQTYEFSGWVYIDVVQKYFGTIKEPYNADIYPGALGFRMGNSKFGSGWLNEDQIHYTPYWNPGNTANFDLNYHNFKYKFTATDTNQTVWLEFYSIYGFHNNGIFLDNFNLCSVNGPADSFSNGRPAQPADGVNVTPLPGATVAPTTAAPVAPAATAVPAKPAVYTVKPGDTLSSIGVSYGVAAADIAAYNKLKNPNQLYVGQVLNIPPWAKNLAPAQPAATPSASGTAAAGTGAKPTSYVVQAGDYLYKIARTLGVSAEALITANKLKAPYVIYAGQVLVVP